MRRTQGSFKRRSRPALFEQPVDAIVECRRPQPACAVHPQLRCSYEFLLCSSSTTRQATMISTSKLPQLVLKRYFTQMLGWPKAPILAVRHRHELLSSLPCVVTPSTPQAGSNWSCSTIGSGHQVLGNFFRTLLQRPTSSSISVAPHSVKTPKGLRLKKMPRHL